jgi:hypothetical protein
MKVKGFFFFLVRINETVLYLLSKRSSEFDVDMPYAVGPIEWKSGIYIHQYPAQCSAG